MTFMNDIEVFNVNKEVIKFQKGYIMELSGFSDSLWYVQMNFFDLVLQI
jgi:hypothetical protein